MSLRLGALQDALLNAGAEDGLAKKAAEEVADYERQIAGLRTEMTVLKWMVGTNVAISLGIMWKVFSL